ncbi:Putative short-chain dehydrogenase/reductase SDR, NAD(P)-binding domain superfamily [Colletotrichum destructivum]|uniref:Short-chain dehydrogenase/reductase SDR, NAD(P)-binding domain superfamily n=1 Tax=Colletotrichum destructivum TaxID=34406 RepID=A0AAX4IIL8_9PEZI|nr:Putative short-chain dehydrogenase/reductase SDR, NAD(P)-binding domain superfamily [Colletotrichum destructivum]
MTVAQGHHNLVSVTRLSPPVDTTQPYDPSTLSGKTVLITGGALGLGAAFAREWASHGANIIVGDVNPSAGEALVATLRTENPKGSHHFVACDVTSWDSQVAFFKEGARLSPDGAVDVVVANAGINDPAANHRFESPVPSATDPDAPTEPSNRIIDVNVTGLSYTAHLALFWLPRNGPSRDRCLVLVGSVAGVHHFPGQSPYTLSKHAVTGLFRSMRATAHLRHGIRLNMVCPYFVSGSSMFPAAAEAALLGGGAGGARFGDVVDATTRLVADEAIVGRALLVGPPVASDDGEDKTAAWDVYAEDYKDCEMFVWRWVRMLNTVEYLRGWTGWVGDALSILTRTVRGGR